jgi:hypothetical protein
MDRDSLLEHLSAKRPPQELANWLRGEFLKELTRRFNQEEVRKKLGLYQGERIPDNERNLTDVRNRVSLIVEYELAQIANSILADAKIDSFFWSYVVANRFPDLEVRNADGTRQLRIEVKNLQSVAEEKSANFDTLIKDVNPSTDFIVVFLWEWGYGDGVKFKWDRAPKILSHFVFHAASLAQLRDAYWLNRPPETLGDGFQGFDLRFAVNCVRDTYAEEEGNYGKLLRIWQEDFEFRPPATSELQDTEAEYIRFKSSVVTQGFWSLCDFHLPKLSRNESIKRISVGGVDVGASAGPFAFLMVRFVSLCDIEPLLREDAVKYLVTMTDKYVCSGYVLDKKARRQVFSRTKPKSLTRRLFGLVDS